MYKVMSNTKESRTRNMRWKRPALASLMYDSIESELNDINEACADVTYFIEDEKDTLLAALDGDEEAEYEFRMAFSDLQGKAESLNDAMRDNYAREYFDDVMVGLIGNRYRTLGYDMQEEDYYGLTSCEQDLAFTKSGEKLMKRTKQEMINVIGHCLGTAIAFLDLRQSYDYLKATFDILRDENTSLLQIVKDIDLTYEAANERNFDYCAHETKCFDALIQNLPDRMWLEC